MEPMREVEKVYKMVDPARYTGQQTSQAERQADLERILATGPEPAQRPARRHSRRRTVLIGAIAVTAAGSAVVSTVLFGPTAQPAQAVTPRPLALHSGVPPLPAASMLEKIAQRAEHDSSGRSTRPGSSGHFVQDSWSLSTRIDGVQVTSAVIPERRETWKKPDGSTRWTVRTQPPHFASDKEREVWKDAGAIGEEPLQRSGEGKPADPWDESSRDAPGDVKGMRGWLSAGYEGSGPGELFDAVSARNLDTAFRPAQRAAILRVLKDAKGIAYRGTVTDRAGRSGAAFTIRTDSGGLPQTSTLVFASDTGKLLAYEEQLDGNAGALKVGPHAVIHYVTYLVSEATRH